MACFLQVLAVDAIMTAVTRQIDHKMKQLGELSRLHGGCVSVLSPPLPLPPSVSHGSLKSQEKILLAFHGIKIPIDPTG